LLQDYYTPSETEDESNDGTEDVPLNESVAVCMPLLQYEQIEETEVMLSDSVPEVNCHSTLL
jgi:hypothetical protein